MTVRKVVPMSEGKSNGATPATAPPEAVTLFDLFKDYEDHTIEWGGQVVPVRVLSLDYGQQLKLNKILDRSRAAARKELDTPDMRAEFDRAARGLPYEQVLDQILVFEEPSAEGLADLAPNVEDDETDEVRAQKIKEALVKWKAQRREELLGLSKDDVYFIIVDRQINLAIQSQAINALIDHSLVEQIVDPATGRRLLSDDPAAPNYYERLSTLLRRRLADLRMSFAMKDAAIRRLAEDGGFLSSGPLPNAGIAIPGGTTGTPSDSRPTSSPSTPDATGSTGSLKL